MLPFFLPICNLNLKKTTNNKLLKQHWVYREIENINFSRFVNQNIPFEFISIEELYSRCKKNNYDLSVAHRIQFHALIIIFEGESKHMVDFKEETISPGFVLPLSKGQVHAFNKELKVKGYVISFEESFMTQNTNSKNLFHFLHIYHTPHILIGKENLAILKPFLSLLLSVHQDVNMNLKSEVVNASFMALLFQVKRLSFYQHKTFESERFKDFIQFKELITQYYTHTHNAKDYAKKLSVSYKYLNDICKEMGHKTAKAFIDHWLLLEIKRNLLEYKFTSQQIAFKMGFNEPSNFIRFFKKHMGLTPVKFQEQFKESTTVID